MRNTRLTSLVLSTALAGCGGSGAPSGPPAVDAGAAAYGQSKAPNKNAPANVVSSFSIALPPVTLQPGEEKTPCWLFDMNSPARRASWAAGT
jgi:hypothetical protein